MTFAAYAYLKWKAYAKTFDFFLKIKRQQQKID